MFPGHGATGARRALCCRQSTEAWGTAWRRGCWAVHLAREAGVPAPAVAWDHALRSRPQCTWYPWSRPQYLWGYLSPREGPPVYILSTQRGHLIGCQPHRCIFLSLFCPRRTTFLKLSERPGVRQSLEEVCTAGPERQTRRRLRKPRTQSDAGDTAPCLPSCLRSVASYTREPRSAAQAESALRYPTRQGTVLSWTHPIAVDSASA